jgi:spermidine synthase
MGYTRHHAIVVVGLPERVEEAHTAAVGLIGDAAPVTAVSPTVTNGLWSFAVLPDGSNDGWPESDKGDQRRDRLVEWLRKHDSCHWAEVQFADDDGRVEVTRHDREKP